MEYINLKIIHPMLLIDDAINILIKEDWTIPMILPIRILIIEIHSIILNHDEKIIKKGGILREVKKKRRDKKLKFLIISGVHLWKGAKPLFSIKAIGGTKLLIKGHSLK